VNSFYDELRTLVLTTRIFDDTVYFLSLFFRGRVVVVVVIECGVII
jgi:hypothetical protein